MKPNSIAVLIPFKAVNVKSRLSPILGEKDRQSFSELMLIDVLDVLASAGLVDNRFVVTSNKRALYISIREGAGVVRENADSGVNAAVSEGIRGVPDTDVFMVVPSDIPLLRASEVKKSISFKERGMDIVLTPSRSFNGTNLLIFTRHRSPRLSYDENSFWNHIRASTRRSFRLAVHTGAGAMFDVDTQADFKELALSGLNRPSVRFARESLR